MDPIQTKTGRATTSTVHPAFDAPTTDGSIVVLVFVSDAYNGSPDSGWTQSAEMEQQTNHGSYLWWRPTDGGESSFTYTVGSAARTTWVLTELPGLSVLPYDASEGQLQVSSASAYSTPAITPTAGDRLLVAVLGGNLATGAELGAPGNWGVLGGSTSFSTAGSIGGEASNPSLCVGVATLAVTANGSTSYSTSAEWTGSANSETGLIIAFKVATPAAPEFTDDPTVTGTPTVGETLTCDNGTVTGTPAPDVSKQWQRDNDGGLSWSDISGATSDTLVLADTERFCNIRCRLAAENASGEDTADSNTVGPVAAPPLDFSVQLSGGVSNSDPAASLGGAMSGFDVNGSVLFASVPAADAEEGLTDYRCVYLNNNDVQDATVVAWLVDDEEEFPGREFFSIGPAAEASGDTVEAIPNATTAPDDVAFGTGTTAETGEDLGTVGQGDGKGVWICRDIPPGTPDNVAHNEARIRFQITPVE